MPDLAIEIASPTQPEDELHSKAAYYLAHSSRMVWLFYDDLEAVDVVTSAGRQRLGLDDALDGGDVLPGFSYSVRTLFARMRRK